MRIIYQNKSGRVVLFQQSGSRAYGVEIAGAGYGPYCWSEALETYRRHKDTNYPGTLDDFINGYITCMLWSSMDCANEDGGEPLDSNYDETDIARKAMREIRRECKDFYRANARTFLPVMGAEQAGHDFWLTRNGHGAGFWDRGLGEVGQRLTDAAKVYGGCDPYVYRRKVYV